MFNVDTEKWKPMSINDLAQENELLSREGTFFHHSRADGSGYAKPKAAILKPGLAPTENKNGHSGLAHAGGPALSKTKQPNTQTTTGPIESQPAPGQEKTAEKKDAAALRAEYCKIGEYVGKMVMEGWMKQSNKELWSKHACHRYYPGMGPTNHELSLIHI